MKLAQYLKTLIPTFAKSNLVSTMEKTIKINSTVTRPLYEGMVGTFTGGYKFKHPEVISIDRFITDMHRSAKLKLPLSQSNSVDGICFILTRLEKTLPVVLAIIEQQFSQRDVSTTGLTYTKGALLQFAEAASFYIKFAGTWANFITSTELAYLDGNRQQPKGVGPDDIEWLNRNRATFAQLSMTFILKTDDVRKMITSITDMIVDEGSEDDVVAIVGASKANPFGFSDVPWPISILQRRALSKAMNDVDELEAAREEAKSIQYRIMMIQEQQRNAGEGGDAYAERQLEIQDERLMNYKRKIARMEEEYDVTHMQR